MPITPYWATQAPLRRLFEKIGVVGSKGEKELKRTILDSNTPTYGLDGSLRWIHFLDLPVGRLAGKTPS